MEEGQVCSHCNANPAHRTITLTNGAGDVLDVANLCIPCLDIMLIDVGRENRDWLNID